MTMPRTAPALWGALAILAFLAASLGLAAYATGWTSAAAALALLTVASPAAGLCLARAARPGARP